MQLHPRNGFCIGLKETLALAATEQTLFSGSRMEGGIALLRQAFRRR